MTSRTRSGLVKVTRAISAMSMAWALPSTICARRRVTTDPVDRRTMRSSRLPSWLLISRTRTRSATLPPSTTRCRWESPPGCRQANGQLFQPNTANIAGRGTSSPARLGVLARHLLGHLAGEFGKGRQLPATKPSPWLDISGLSQHYGWESIKAMACQTSSNRLAKVRSTYAAEYVDDGDMDVPTYVRHSTAGQGLPEKLQDEATLIAVAGLIRLASGSQPWSGQTQTHANGNGQGSQDARSPSRQAGR